VPPEAPSVTAQVTVVSGAPVTRVANWRVLPTTTVAVVGASTRTTVAVGTVATTWVMLLLPGWVT